METAPLKSFATWARNALIREVTARIAAVMAPGSSERVEQARAVAALEKAIGAAGGGDKGRAAVADKVAYTWFNRIIALRFMDANGYTGIGVVSPQAGLEVGQPEILADAKRGVIDTEVVSQTTRTAVAGLLDETRASGDPQGEAYALLLADYCRHWNRAMPFMFEREGDFTELLVPANLLADDSVLNRSVKVLSDDVARTSRSSAGSTSSTYRSGRTRCSLGSRRTRRLALTRSPQQPSSSRRTGSFVTSSRTHSDASGCSTARRRGWWTRWSTTSRQSTRRPTSSR